LKKTFSSRKYLQKVLSKKSDLLKDIHCQYSK
jgi:hypothetical protein